jgi:hypothetical protein
MFYVYDREYRESQAENICRKPGIRSRSEKTTRTGSSQNNPIVVPFGWLGALKGDELSGAAHTGVTLRNAYHQKTKN